MDTERPGDGRDIHLLDEFESWDCRELAQKCFQFQEIHKPKDWIGDGEHGTIKNIFYEMNEPRREDLDLSTPRIIMDAYEQPYLYMLPEIKRLRDSERRLLHLEDDSAVLRYMAELLPEEPAELKLGAFPVIEALSFSIIEVVRIAKAGQHDYNVDSDQGVLTEDLLSV